MGLRQTISILGSTGSIGTNTIDVIKSIAKHIASINNIVEQPGFLVLSLGVFLGVRLFSIS